MIEEVPPPTAEERINQNLAHVANNALHHTTDLTVDGERIILRSWGDGTFSIGALNLGSRQEVITVLTSLYTGDTLEALEAEAA